MRTHLTLSGPFLTTKILDPQRLGATDGNVSQLRARYVDVQSRLGNCLSQADQGWNISDASLETDTDYDGKSYTGSALFPEFIARCDIPNSELVVAVKQWTIEPYGHKFFEHLKCGASFQFGTITFDACRISIHDFGVGIVELDLTCIGIGEEKIAKFRVEIEALSSSLASLSSILVGPKLERFLGCLDKDPDIGRAFTTMTPGTSSQYRSSRPKVLWIHRIYAVTGESWEGSDAGLADELLARHHTYPCENVSISPLVCLYPSIAGSLAFARGSDGNSFEFAEPLRCAISLQNAYNAGIWMFDDILFGRTIELMGEQDRLANDNVKLEDLMNHAHRILRLSSYISTFLSVLHNRISRSSPQQLILIDKISQAWRMELQREALERKLAVLKEMHEVTLRLLADSEARRLNMFALAFTLISLLTVITTLADFAVKLEKFDGFSLWRTALVVGSLVFVAITGFGIIRFRDILARLHVNIEPSAARSKSNHELPAKDRS